MKKNIVLIIVIVVLALAGIAFFVDRSSSEAPETKVQSNALSENGAKYEGGKTNQSSGKNNSKSQAEPPPVQPGAQAPVTPAVNSVTPVEMSKWEIKIQDFSYDPSTVEIKKGESVTWTNYGTRKNWPASNNHPSHGNYPESGGCIGSTFDACAGLSEGESYTFTFNELGTWKYHDHLAPGLVGAVTVTN